VVAGDGSQAVRASMTGPAAQAAKLGHDVAAELLRRGAGTIVAASAAVTAPGPRAPDPATRPGGIGIGDDAQ